MGRLKPDTRNLSQGEADTIVSIVKKVLDVIVDMTGGNLRLEVRSKNLSDAKHEIMNDSINRCWLAVRRTRVCRFVYMVRVFFLKLLINHIAYV